MKLALELAREGIEIHSPNMPEYKVCAALIEALAKQEQRNVTKDEHDVLMKALAKSGKVVDAGFLAKQEQIEPDYKALWKQMCERCDELDAKLAKQEQDKKRKLLPRCFADYQSNHTHDRKCEWCAVNTECKTGEQTKQEQGEPAAWLYPEGLEALQAGKCWTAYPTKHETCDIPLYTTPQQRKPLTASHIKKAVRGTGDLLNHTQAWDVTTAVMELLAEHGIEVTA